jgi:hypothetical protein
MMWEVMYWVLLVIAIVALGRGLLWDRAGFRGRPQRRCRSCWYDLTGVDGDVLREPVVCPECGKAHKTKRSMRKTRRTKRWLAVALGLWILAYGARVTPSVQQHGWGAAVPRVVLVAALPFMSEQQGSGLRTAMPFPVTTITISTLESVVLEEIEREWRAQRYNPGQVESEFGWVSARLAFVLARIESESDLCNGTTAKGTAYQSLLTSLIQNDRAYTFEENWARSQNEIEIDIDRGFAVDEPVYGHVRLNTLVRDVETVRFGDFNLMYSLHARPNRSGFGAGGGPGPAGATPRERDQAIIESNRWSAIWNLKDDSGYGGFDTQVFPLGDGYPDATGQYGVHVLFQFGRFARNDQGHVDRDADPVIVHNEREFSAYPIDHTRSIIRDGSAALKNWIERSFEARMRVEYNGKQQAWVPVIQLEPRTDEAWENGPLVFGGYVRVLEVPANGDAYPKIEYMQGSHVWWRWAAPDPIIEERELNDSQHEQSPFQVGASQHARPQLVSQNAMRIGRTGQLRPNTYVIGRRIDTSSKMVVAMQANISTQLRFGGLWGEFVYDGQLEFDLPHWTRRDFEQFIVNGIAPVHAFPGRD